MLTATKSLDYQSKASIYTHGNSYESDERKRKNKYNDDAYGHNDNKMNGNKLPRRTHNRLRKLNIIALQLRIFGYHSKSSVRFFDL